MDVLFIYDVEIIANEQNCMRLCGFDEKIYTVAFGFMITCSLKVWRKLS